MKVLTMQKHRMTRVSKTFYRKSRAQDRGEGSFTPTHNSIMLHIMLICSQIYFINNLEVTRNCIAQHCRIFNTNKQLEFAHCTAHYPAL